MAIHGPEAYKLEQDRKDALLEMEKSKGSYTSEQVQRWKDLDLTRPEWVSESDWKIGGELTPRISMVCKASALLTPPDEISELTGLSRNRVKEILASTIGKEEIEKIQDRFFSNTKKMLDEILPLAIKTAFQVMLDPNTKPQTKAETAFRFMDRVMGRPVQQVDINENLIRGVYEKLDSQKVIDIAAHRIDAVLAVTTEKEPEEIIDPIDPVDAWVKENLK